MIHVVECLHVDAERLRHGIHVEAEGCEELEELHLLAGQRIREGGTRVVALRPAAPLEHPQTALLRLLDLDQLILSFQQLVAIVLAMSSLVGALRVELLLLVALVMLRQSGRVARL